MPRTAAEPEPGVVLVNVPAMALALSVSESDSPWIAGEVPVVLRGQVGRPRAASDHGQGPPTSLFDPDASRVAQKRVDARADEIRHRAALSSRPGSQGLVLHLGELDLATHVSDDRILAIDDALDRLALQDSQAAQLVKLRFFAGFSLSEAAQIVGISRTNAYEQWAYARAWLRLQVQTQD